MVAEVESIQIGDDKRYFKDSIGRTHDMPTGGTAGQILTKKTSGDYDTMWGNAGGAAVWGGIGGDIGEQSDLIGRILPASEVLPIANGGTGSTTAKDACSALSAVRASNGALDDVTGTTLAALAASNPGAYLVNKNATGSPDPENYGDLLIARTSGDRMVALFNSGGGKSYTWHGNSGGTWRHVMNVDTSLSALPVTAGGTSATTAAEARENLGISFPLPISNGGTGATTAAAARTKLDAVYTGGDAMTGLLRFGSEIDQSTAPSSTAVSKGPVFCDKDGNDIGWVRAYQQTDGAMQTDLRVQRTVSGSTVANIIRACLDASGNKTYQVSDPAAFRDAIAGAYAVTTWEIVVAATSGMDACTITFSNGVPSAGFDLLLITYVLARSTLDYQSTVAVKAGDTVQIGGVVNGTNVSRNLTANRKSLVVASGYKGESTVDRTVAVPWRIYGIQY